MIVIYNNSTASGIIGATALKRTCEENGVPIIAIACNDPRAVSIPVMKSLLGVSIPARATIVFMDLLPDVGSEQFLARHADVVRSVHVIGNEPYLIGCHEFRRAVRARCPLLVNKAGMEPIIDQVRTLFEDPEDFNHKFNQVLGDAHRILAAQ